MKKKLISVFLAMFFVFSLSSCGLGEQLKIKYENTDGGVALKSFKGTSNELHFTVPDEVEGNSVVKLSDFSIANAEYVEVITLGKNITEIGVWAISNCPKLKQINVDSENKSFVSVDGVLYTKDMKKLIAYPNLKDKVYRVLDGTEEISENAFYKCLNIEEITLPENMKKISDRAFMRCSALKSINIPSTVTEIGVDTFSFSNKLENIFIPSSVSKIGDYAFFGCSSLKRVDFERASSDGVTLGADWLPVKEGSVSERIPVMYSQMKGAK